MSNAGFIKCASDKSRSVTGFFLHWEKACLVEPGAPASQRDGDTVIAAAASRGWGFEMRRLHRRGARSVLRPDPSRWPVAIEELLRFDSPVQATIPVTSAEPVEIVDQDSGRGCRDCGAAGGEPGSVAHLDSGQGDPKRWPRKPPKNHQVSAASIVSATAHP
jgi:hypothetical protein